jgi:hypothetical protein
MCIPPPLDYSPLPASLRAGVRRWVEDHVSPGDFLCAVIRNDLSTAIALADDDNLPRLAQIVRWFYWEAPGLCWGSKAAFEEWRAARKVAA